MRKANRGANLYILSLALLATHEVDSGYWQEWKLFGLPGGPQLFMILNFALLFLALIGLKKILLGEKAGQIYALYVAGSGLFCFLIHSFFLLTGHQSFNNPTSIILLLLILIVSAVQWTTSYHRVKANTMGGR